MLISNEGLKSLESYKIDCKRCSGLCCTALTFSKQDGFPEDKPTGKACSKLDSNYLCSIHKQLKDKKLRGCIGYDCFGAGQHVTQVLYKGSTWQDNQDKSDEIFSVFVRMTQLFQIRYYLTLASFSEYSSNLKDKLSLLIKENEKLCYLPVKEILDLDLTAYREKVNPLLKQVRDDILRAYNHQKEKLSLEYFGKNLSKKNLSGYDFSMKLLIAANFTSCSLNDSIFIAADTRDCDFSKADLSRAVFLSQGQVNAAKGNKETKLPAYLSYPVTWD